MLFRTVTLVFISGIVLMAIYSTLEGCKPTHKVQNDLLDELLYANRDSNDRHQLRVKLNNVWSLKLSLEGFYILHLIINWKQTQISYNIRKVELYLVIPLTIVIDLSCLQTMLMIKYLENKA